MTPATSFGRWRTVRLLVVLLLALPGWLCGSQGALAHAELISTDPVDGAHLDQAPDQIVLTFSEPVGVVEDATTLYPGSATPVALSPQPSGAVITIPLQPGLPDGTWTVQWRVVSADGHPISGTLSFTVGAATPAPEVKANQLPGWVGLTRTVATAAKYVGLLAAAGVLIVGRVLAPADWRFVRALIRRFATVAVAGVAAELPLIAVEQRGSLTGSLTDAIGNLNPSTLWAALLCMAFLVAGIAGTRLGPSPGWTITSGLIAAALFTQILSGHTRSREPVWLMMAADTVHLLAGATWLGGIVVLALGLSGRWRGDAFASSKDSAAAVARFSRLAAYTAVLVVATGVAMAMVILRSRDALLNTGYGTTLLIKVCFVALVLILAAVNRWVLIPRLWSSDTRAMTQFRRLVVIELVVLLAVGGVTARLVSQDPTVQVIGQVSSGTVVYEGEQALDDHHTVTLTVVALGNQEYEVHGTLVDTDGIHVVLIEGMEVSWVQPALGLGPIQQNLAHDHIAHDYAGVVRLPANGIWEATVRADIDRFTDSRVTITVDLSD